jgi:hypothetical protein
VIHLGHPNQILEWVESVERSGLAAELISKNDDEITAAHLAAYAWGCQSG